MHVFHVGIIPTHFLIAFRYVNNINIFSLANAAVRGRPIRFKIGLNFCRVYFQSRAR